MSDKPLDAIASLAASQLVTSSILSELVPQLMRSGALTADQARDVYEQALLAIETQRGQVGAEAHYVFDAARELIEEHLRKPR